MGVALSALGGFLALVVTTPMAYFGAFGALGFGVLVVLGALSGDANRGPPDAPPRWSRPTSHGIATRRSVLIAASGGATRDHP